jgi:hypothetical protein
MKKFTFTIMVVAVVVLALGAAGVAYAQSASQGTGTGSGSGWMGGRGARGGMGNGNTSVGDGILHDYMIAAFAEELNIPVADLEARIEQGETMAQIAVSTGLTVDEFRTLMVDARTQAIGQWARDAWRRTRAVRQPRLPV